MRSKVPSRRMRAVAAAAGLSLLTAACAGRAPAPVPVVQAVDDTMACDAIRSEVAANNQRIADLGSERGAKVAQNIAAGIGGILFILPFFLMDFQDAAGIDERALKSRNDYLATLARARCSGTQTAGQSARPAS